MRFLLLVITVVAVFCWWVSAPYATANKFIRFVNANELQAAAELFVVEGKGAMLSSWPSAESKAWVPKMNWLQRLTGVLRGRQRVELTVTYTVLGQTEQGLFPLEASHRGMHALYAPLDHNFRGRSTSVGE